MFDFQDKIILRYNLGLNCDISLAIRGLAMTNYPMIIHVVLSCGIEYNETNTL